MEENDAVSVEKYERETSRNYELGIGVGIERCASWLMQEALEHYQEGKDAPAELLRALARRYKKVGVEEVEKARSKQRS
jgi:hypothetical protein